MGGIPAMFDDRTVENDLFLSHSLEINDQGFTISWIKGSMKVRWRIALSRRMATRCIRLMSDDSDWFDQKDVGVSIDGGSPTWLAYNGNSMEVHL